MYNVYITCVCTYVCMCVGYIHVACCECSVCVTVLKHTQTLIPLSIQQTPPLTPGVKGQQKHTHTHTQHTFDRNIIKY